MATISVRRLNYGSVYFGNWGYHLNESSKLNEAFILEGATISVASKTIMTFILKTGLLFQGVV